MPILRYTYIFLILRYPYPASFSPNLKKLVLEFCTEVERRNPSKETTSHHSATKKTIGLLTSLRKVVMKSADATSCQLEVR